MGNIEDIKQALNKGNHKLGNLVWYDCANISVTPTRMVHLFEKHGLNMKYMPDSIKPKFAFQKACKMAVNHDNGTTDTRKSVVKLIEDGIDTLVYGIVDLDVNKEEEEINPNFSDKIWLNKSDFTVKSQNGHPLCAAIKVLYDKLCGEYVTRDISRMIVAAIKDMASISLRDSGVVYFIPAAYDTEITALQGVVNDLGNSDMRLFALSSGDGNDSRLESTAKSQIANKIEKMKEELNELKTSIEDGKLKGKTIDNSIEVRRQRYNKIKEQCRVLADALRIKAEDLEGNLSEIDIMIKKELEGFLSV